MAENIAQWLDGLGLGRYARAFADNGVELEHLPHLTDDDLKELGLPLGPRRHLQAAVQSLSAAEGSDRRGDPSSSGVTVRSPIEAERRQLTVLFCDLVGSTALSGRLDPEDMGDVIRAYQNTVAGGIGRFDGHVAKFMGDGVLAYFGWPHAHEDEGERAVRAGLALTQAVGRLVDPAGEALAARVGIATGLVVVGDLVGEGAAQEEAVVGETPNLAARIQELAGPGQVVIAEGTRRLLGDLFLLDELGPRPLKGVREPVPAYAVRGERRLESRFAARAGGAAMTPIVGREQELALLRERWQQAKAGEGQMVLLGGEAGIGKSRITESLLQELRQEPHTRIRYQGSPYHGDSALWPVIQQLGRAAGFVVGESTEARLDKLEALLARGTDEPRRPAALLAVVLGIDGESRYGPLELTPQQRRNRTLEALIDQLMGLAAAQPVLFVLEDAHWIDPTTLELVESSLDRVAGARVLMLVTARPVFSHGFGGHPIVTRLVLNRLGRVQTATIMERIAGGRRLPDALVDEIAARTDGVPLYVEEMTKAVLESGFLRETEGEYLLDAPLSRLAIPTSLHDSLMARLDRLQPVKEVAQTAAVIGRAFDHQTIATLSSLPEAELAEAMQRLVEAELVFRRGTPPEANYLFKHALVRDAAYESLLKTKRIALHARLVEILENQVDAAPEIVAQHAEAAGLVPKAIDYWEQAGTEAVARPAYSEGIAHFNAAIRLCHEVGDRASGRRRELQLQVQLGPALMAHFGYQGPATLTAFERALELAEDIGEPDLLIPSIFGLWAGRYIANTPSADLADRLAELTASDIESGSRCVALRMLALERFHEGRYETSLQLVHEALSIYDPVAHRDLAFRYGHDPCTAATNYRAWNLWYLGFPDQAREAAEEALAWARELDHPNTIGLALSYGVALTNIWLRDVERVESAARESLQLAEKMSLALWQVWGRIHLGWAMADTAGPEGLAQLEAGVEEASRMGVRRLEPFHVGLLADVQSRVGHHDAAMATFADAFGALARSGDKPFGAELHRLRASATLRASGPAEEAIGDLRQAVEIARHQGAPSLELRAARDLAGLWADRGERKKALDLLTPVYDRFTEGFDTPDLEEAKALLDRLG
jgi:class 3 adenylate cyclase/tetratricopeptide (TPR) repeat protein